MNENSKTSADEEVNGAVSAAKILSAMPQESRKRLLSAIEADAPAAFNKIKNNTLSFENIPDILPRGIQVLVRETSHDDLVLAVAHGSIKIKEALLKNMSERSARAVLAESTQVLNVNAQDVANMQNRIVEKIDELRKAGLLQTNLQEDIWVD